MRKARFFDVWGKLANVNTPFEYEYEYASVNGYAYVDQRWRTL